MKKFALILAESFCLILISNAQPGALDLTFDPGTGANSEILATAIQDNGKIIIAGAFTSYNGIAISRIARLNTDGSLDTTFNPGTGAIGGRIYACGIQQSDGKIVIGGSFTSFNGTAINRIARLDTSGSLDTTFNPGAGADKVVRSVSIQSNGRIIIAGDFTTFDGSPLLYIARLDTNGSLDSGFSPVSPNGSVRVTAIQSDGKIVIGGDFTLYGSSLSYRLARLNTNGSVDASFNQFGGPSQGVNTIAIQESDGKSIIGGDFQTYSAVPAAYFARINTNGTLDGGFRPVGPNGSVGCIAIQDDEQIIIGGGFTTYNGTAINHVARINTNGSLDNSFDPGTGADASVHSISIQSDGKIIIGGYFHTYTDTSRNRIARLYSCRIPKPGAILGSLVAHCPGSIHTYSINPVPGADNYKWSLPAGWSGYSDSTSIIATSDGSGGIISVRAYSNTCGYSDVQTLTVSPIQVPNVPICLVTVDTASTHNIIIWEKPVPGTSVIDSFFIYRESIFYEKIASIAYDSFSAYHDYGANPNATPYNYKLSILDTCGVESQKSGYHKTIHLQNLGDGNFQWTLYEIENDTNHVSWYNVNRDDLGNGNFQPIDTVSGSNQTYTDVSYASFPDANYVIDVNWDISCTPSRSVNTTRSNIKRIIMIDPVNIESILPDNIEVYPNPATETITLNFPSSLTLKSLDIFNILGELVYTEIPLADFDNTTKQINVEGFAKGIYTLKAETNFGTISKKLIF